MLESLYKKVTDRRYNSFIYVIAGLFMLLVLRLFVLQLIDGEHYRELADGNRIRQMTIQATRGVLLDRNGEIIVGSRPVYIVSYTPQQKPMDAALEARLANVLQMTPADIQKKIKDRGTSFGPVPIKVDIGPDIVAKIEEYRAEYPGVTIEVQPLRYYPYGSLAANVIGYVGEAGQEDRKPDGSEFAPGTIVGRAGLELYYNDLLQ
ncbi:MAG: penicillin-binding protein 2, partial [Negativicoccus succinicivorans]|nr:penicillin-binding protein 2 [Negativicoccus succinicivorans]